MTVTVHPVFLLVCAFLFFFILKFCVSKIELKQSSKHAVEKYSLIHSTLTKTELKFYQALVPALPNNVTMLIKPRIADFVNVTIPKSNRSAYTSAFNRIRSKHVDFLLCDKLSLKPLLAIELDDSSHNALSTQKRDAFVNGLYQDIGLPICRFPVARSYDQKEISSKISFKLGASPPPLPKSS